MTRLRQQGSVLGYVLVGAALVALLIAGIYVIRRNTSAAVVAQNTNQTASSDQSTSTSQTATNSDTQTNQTAGDSQKSEEQKAQDQNAAVAAENKTDSSATNSSQTTNATSSYSSTSGSALPHTGPAEDMFASILGAGLLAGSLAAYRRSRAVL